MPRCSKAKDRKAFSFVFVFFILFVSFSLKDLFAGVIMQHVHGLEMPWLGDQKAVYTGALDDMKRPTGKGRLETKSGVYVGEMREGKMEGPDFLFLQGDWRRIASPFVRGDE